MIGATMKKLEYICCYLYINPIALRKAKIVYNFGLSECNRINMSFCTILALSHYA